MHARLLLASLVGALSLLPGARAQQPLLQLQGQPYFDGAMTLHVTAPSGIGDIVWLGVGLDPLPLDAPVSTNKGPWYIGTFLTPLLLGTIQSNGRLDLPFTMPPATPGVEGTIVALQVYVSPSLSNPATLILDEPYFLAAGAVAIDNPLPKPTALFGDRVAVGDFNSDGVADLAVGAWLESGSAMSFSGAAYVLWGPSFTAFTKLEPTTPKYIGTFGEGLTVADINGDSIDDLVVAEDCGGDPPTAGAHGYLHVYKGGVTFTDTPWISIPSAGTAGDAELFGRWLTAGDLNGDGTPDLVVGQAYASVGNSAFAGRLEIYWGPTFDSFTLLPNPEPKAEDYFGNQVCLADVTGDGRIDIVESSGRANAGGIVDAGRLHVFDGPTLALLATVENPSPAIGDRFGEGLHAADLDGDNIAEIIVSDVKDNRYIVWDPLQGGTIAVEAKPPAPAGGNGDSSYGYFLAAGLLNGDDRMDIVIADPFEGDLPNCPFGAEGTLLISLAPYYSTYYRLVSPIPHCADGYGWSLRVFDVEGNGPLDILSGAPTTDIGSISNAGRVIVIKY